MCDWVEQQYPKKVSRWRCETQGECDNHQVTTDDKKHGRCIARSQMGHKTSSKTCVVGVVEQKFGRKAATLPTPNHLPQK